MYAGHCLKSFSQWVLLLHTQWKIISWHLTSQFRKNDVFKQLTNPLVTYLRTWTLTNNQWSFTNLLSNKRTLLSLSYLFKLNFNYLRHSIITILYAKQISRRKRSKYRACAQVHNHDRSTISFFPPAFHAMNVAQRSWRKIYISACECNDLVRFRARDECVRPAFTEASTNQRYFLREYPNQSSSDLQHRDVCDYTRCPRRLCGVRHERVVRASAAWHRRREDREHHAPPGFLRFIFSERSADDGCTASVFGMEPRIQNQPPRFRRGVVVTLLTSSSWN